MYRINIYEIWYACIADTREYAIEDSINVFARPALAGLVFVFEFIFETSLRNFIQTLILIFEYGILTFIFKHLVHEKQLRLLL